MGGKPLCRWCTKPVTAPRRTTFCSDECVHEWRLRRDAAYLRACVMQRDNGVCEQCGLDTIAEYHRLQLLARTDTVAYAAQVETRKIPENRKSLWDADHKLPVADGGGECGLENIRTLCIWCHRKRKSE
jgi:5-methylcytosine-specific restriction protein A